MKTKLLVLTMLLSPYAMANNFTPAQEQFHQAILQDSSRKMERIIISEATKNNRGKSTEWFLMTAILNDDVQEIKRRGKQLVCEGKNGNPPVIWAALLKKPNAVKTLLECGAPIDPEIVKYAIQVGDFKSALTIVRSGVNISRIMQDCMELCISSNKANISLKVEFIQELFNRGYNINEALNCRALYLTQNSSILRFLLHKGANPNYRTTKSFGTPLLIATCCKSKQAIEMLLNAGANINLAGKGGYKKPITPLFLAINNNPDSGIVELLLNRGARY